MDQLFQSHSHLILDACCLLNLYASGELAKIISAFTPVFTVASYVKEKEVLNIYDGPTQDVRSIKKEVDLEPFVSSGSILVVSPENPIEIHTYVNFASELDDGEAITGAIAFHRNWCMGTDDKKAISFLSKNGLHLSIASTLDIVKYWADSSNPPREMICHVLENIKRKANYEPGTNHQLYEWWDSHSRNI